MKLSFNGENNRQGKTMCLVFLKIPESSWFPTNANLDHRSTNSTIIFFFIIPQWRCGRIFVAHGTKWWKSLRDCLPYKRSIAFPDRKPFFLKKKTTENETNQPTNPKHKTQHNKTTPFKVNTTLWFSLCNIIHILFCKFMFLQNCSKVLL